MVLAKDYASIREMINRHIVDKKDEEIRMERKFPDLFTGIEGADYLKSKIWEDDFLMTI